MAKIETKNAVVQYQDDQETKEVLFQTILKWFTKHESFCGEVLVQSDFAYEELPDFMGDVAEKIFKFDLEWKE